MSYQLTIEERPTYIYARADGELTPANTPYLDGYLYDRCDLERTYVV